MYTVSFVLKFDTGTYTLSSKGEGVWFGGGTTMTITYIDHSSFLVELNQHYLLFDYFQGDILKLDPGKPLLVFASHRHGDHFSPVIFNLAREYPKVSYVLSDDIWQNRVPEELYGRTIFMGEDEIDEIESVAIKTYHSTDEGVAFLVEAEGKTIYHAGDLNHWNWIGEPELWNRQMGENYQKELDKMAGEQIDVAFLPVDARLKENFYLGADDFMKTVGAKVIFPMHFWGDYTVGERWKALPCAEGYRDRVVEIRQCGERFVVE